MVGLKMKTRLKIAFRPKGCTMNNKWFIYSGPSQSFVALGDKSVYVNLVVGLKSLRSRLKIAFSPMGCAMNEKSYNIIL